MRFLFDWTSKLVKKARKMWKVNCSTWHKCGTKKTSESLTAIKPMTSWNLGGCSIHWATRTQSEQGNCNWIHMHRTECPSCVRCLSWVWFLSGTQIFLCPTLVSRWSVHISSPSLKFTLFTCWSQQGECFEKRTHQGLQYMKYSRTTHRHHLLRILRNQWTAYRS